MSDAFVDQRIPLVTSKNGNVNNVDSIPLGHSPTKPIQPVKQTIALSTPPTKAQQQHIQFDQNVGLFAREMPNMPPPNMSNHDHVIVCKKSIALLLGRARALGAEEEDESLHSSSTREVIGGIPIKRVSLPNTAKHVSRDHCIIYHTPFNGSSWAVKILGQNGLIVDGKRHRAGSIIRLVNGQSILDFFGGATALFVHAQEDAKSKTVSTQKKSVQNGQSPTKKRKTMTANVMVEEQPRLIGNMAKRPLGAPLSPPTSSPAHFNAPSSPSIANSLFGKRGNLLASSSPNNNEEDEEDDDEDMLNSSRAASPTLERRANKPSVDDSGVLLCDDDNNEEMLVATPTESEDEASQALALSSSNVITKNTTKAINKRKAEILANRKSSKSPAGTPQRNKNVKFNVRGGGEKDAVNGNSNTKTNPALHPLKMQSVQRHFRALVNELAQTYDLQGLLAGVIVFHRTATISATEAVRSVLSSNPGLMRGEVGPDGGENVKLNTERGKVLKGWTYEDIVEKELIKSEEAEKERVEVWQRKAWRERLEECLMEGECFGIIQRAGKDASGNPLECWYYYDKDLDLDAQRAANLGPFVKPMRAALKTHKPIFWRKSAYGTTSDDVKALQIAEGQQQSTSVQTGGVSESQWGSSGSTLNSAILSGQPTKKDDDSVNPLTRNNPIKSNTTTRTQWEETQFEENEQTWDKEGDLDFEVNNGRKTKKRK